MGSCLGARQTGTLGTATAKEAITTTNTTQPQKQEHNNKKHNNSSAERAQAQFQEKKAGKVKQQSLQEQRTMKESEKDKE